MTEPKSGFEKWVEEIDMRLENLEKHQARVIEAVSTMAAWLVSAQTGFGQKDMEGINDILYGRTETASEGSTTKTE